MANKPRRFDLSPDNFIAGIAGLLTSNELGVYWIMCLLFYSHGGPFDYDEARICAILKGTHWRTVRKALEQLHKLGKITSENGQITVKGCAEPLQAAVSRVLRASENGVKGGRPSNENKDIAKPEGLSDEKLARVAPSPPPSHPQPPPLKSSSLRSESAKTGEPDGFDLFYNHYPLKKARRAAIKAYASAVKRGATPEKLLAAAQRYAHQRRGEDPQFTKHPATWLNQDCWLDEEAKGHDKQRHRPDGQRKTNLDTHLAGVASALREMEPGNNGQPLSEGADQGAAPGGDDSGIIEGRYRVGEGPRPAADGPGNGGTLRDAAGQLPDRGDDRGAEPFEIPDFLRRSGTHSAAPAGSRAGALSAGRAERHEGEIFSAAVANPRLL